jgi:hypothetical protein
MIIKTKKTKIAGNNSQGEMMVQTAEENKPGLKLRKKVVESYETNIKPGIKNAASKAKVEVKKAVKSAGSDLKEMITRK